MKRRILYENIGGSIDPSLSTACDICFYNSQSGQLEIVAKDQFTAGGTTAYPSTTYTPIGVVVVPGTHGVLRDVHYNVQCGVISLKYMDYSTPDTGNINSQKIYWGGYGTDVSLTNYDKVVTASSATANNASSNNTTGYLPLNGGYRNSDYVPSPYIGSDLKSGAFNPAYSNTTVGTFYNALSEFDGLNNTSILTNSAVAQTNWRTASTITNSSGSGYYPAACCCWRYHTPGTQQGDWYLPACGELGYIVPKFSEINDTIDALITAYGSSIGVQLESHYFWSSTEYSGNYSRYISTKTGLVDKYNRSYTDMYVRAFLRV